MTSSKEIDNAINHVRRMAAKYKFTDNEIKSLSSLMAASKALLMQ